MGININTDIYIVVFIYIYLYTYVFKNVHIPKTSDSRHGEGYQKFKSPWSKPGGIFFLI